MENEMNCCKKQQKFIESTAKAYNISVAVVEKIFFECDDESDFYKKILALGKNKLVN